MRRIFRNGLFPEANNRNVFLYYLVNAALNMWFTEAVWYFYWGRFASYSVVGLFFSITSAVQLLTTIPTGALADMFGQKKAVVLGLCILVMGSILISLGPTIWYLGIGVILQGLGRSFITGALDALVFESLKNAGKSDAYPSVVSFNTQLTILAFAITALFGGWLYSIYFRLAHILTTLAYCIAFISSFFFVEIQVKKTHVNYVRSFISHHKRGFTELWLPQMRTFIIPALVIFVFMRMYDWGISKPTIAVGFGFYAKEQSVIYSLLAIVCAVIVGQLAWFKKRINDINGVMMMGVLISIGFISSYFPLRWWGLISMLTIESAGRLSYAWVPAIVNTRISSTYRATTLSTLDFIGRVPYIGLNFIAGMAVDHKLISQFHALLGAIGLIFLFIWFVITKKRANSSV